MMSLYDVARYADTVVFTDAHGSSTFFGQLLLFNDSTRSGPATKRRILDVGPDVVMPTRKTITEALTGVTYIVSVPSYDYYDSTPIRAKYPVTPADGQVHIRTIGEVLSDTGGVTDAYADLTYLRRAILEDQSAFEQGFDVFFSSYYDIARGTIIYFDGHYYRTRQDSRRDEAGFTAVEVVQVYNPIHVVTFQSKGTTYDPVDDDFTPPAAVENVEVFVESAFLDFVHEALGFIKIEPGDKCISFLKTVVDQPAVGDSIGGYKIISLSDIGSFWSAHCRPDGQTPVTVQSTFPYTFPITLA